MYISLDWVNELVRIETIKLQYLIDKLTLAGFEVEDILKINVNNNEKMVLDISATANRADSLSVKGISKEIGALLNTSYNTSKYRQENIDITNRVFPKFQTSRKSEDYLIFLAISVKNFTNSDSPKWLKEKLISSRIEPTNTLLDFQNYILLETGYPIEFYDLEKIQKKTQTSNFTLNLKLANNDDTFLVKENIEYKLNSQILTLQANDCPLSIAGIVSHHDVCYDKTTKSLFIEAAVFKSKKIRQQSRILGLRTERSARYEKGLNTDMFLIAVWRLFSLLKISNPNLLFKIHTLSQIETVENLKIKLNYSTICEILGPTLTQKKQQKVYLLPKQINNYLSRLNFNFHFNENEKIWLVKVPTSRINDIEREIDLIEEIGRLHGFNNFITNLPKISRIGIEDFSYQTRKKLTQCLINQGFNELIHYSLGSITNSNSNQIELLNPLLIDCSVLRTSLLPNLIRTTSENLKQGNSNLSGFEYGHIFLGDINCQFFEQENIAGIFGGIKLKNEWNANSNSMSWFEAKAKIEEIFKKLNILIYWKKASISQDYKLLHFYRTAELYLINGQKLGFFGQIHPIVAKKESIPFDLFLFEFNFELINSELQILKLPFYQEYSLYPKISKDISFIISRNIPFSKIKKLILNYGTTFLVNLQLLDQYEGASIPEDKISLCIELSFQSKFKTLINNEVEEILENLKMKLQEELNLTIRL
jgi:phenylalanyl-tRNA synthetase beta chain